MARISSAPSRSVCNCPPRLRRRCRPGNASPNSRIRVAELNPGALRVLECASRCGIILELRLGLAVPVVQPFIPNLLLAHIAGDDGESVGIGRVGAGVCHKPNALARSSSESPAVLSTQSPIVLRSAAVGSNSF
jgi:hypothetical protein